MPYLGAPEPYFFGSGVAGAGGDSHGRWDFLIGPDYTSPSFLTSETLSVVIDGRIYALNLEMHRAHHSGVFFGTDIIGTCKVLVADFAVEGEPWVARLVRVQNLSPNQEARVSVRAEVVPAKADGITTETVDGKAVRITADKTAFCFGSEVKNWANRTSTIAFSTPSTVGASPTGYELATAETTLLVRSSVVTGLYHFQTYGSANVRYDGDHPSLQDSARRTQHSKEGKAPNPGQDLQASLTEWHRWLARGRDLDSVIKDPKARAIVEGSLAAVRMQQDRDGGFIAGARKYANSYVRDSHGGVRLLLATGHYEEARKVIETIHHRWKVAGFIPNYWSMGSDFFIGRSFVNDSSEIPAYYALMIRDYLAATHDRKFAEGIEGSLKFAVDTQLDFMAKNGWRIDFNGDETEQYCDTKDGQEYGGFPAFKEWSPKSWSFASSALACASTQFYIDWLRSKGPSTKAESYETKLKKVKDAIDATFLRTGDAPPSCAPAEERGLGERFRDSAGRQDLTSNGLRFTRRPVRSKNSHNSPGACERIVSQARLSLANHNTLPPVGRVGELDERSEIPHEFRLRAEIGANRGRGLAGRPTSEYFHSIPGGGLKRGASERTAREARLKPFHHWIRYQDGSWPTSIVPNYDLMPLWVGAHLNGEAQNQDARAMASYRNPDTGFLPTAPPFVNGFCGHNLGYLLYALTKLGDPRSTEVFRTMMNSSLYGCWGTVSEFYGPNGTPNGHNFRVFESGIDAEAIIKYFERPRTGASESKAGSIRFYGTRAADLFTKEVAESMRGVLDKDFIDQPSGSLPAGYVQASPTGQIWSGTMWSRDAGAFLRELVQWGYLEQAAKLSDCLISLVRKNGEGYFAFPEHFEGAEPSSGSELDGTGAIIVGMVALRQRLPAGNPCRKRIEGFLEGAASPVAYIVHRLQTQSLIAGTGEFGPGCGLPGEAVNVVQNGLVVLALDAASWLYQGPKAEHLRTLSSSIEKSMLAKLVDGEGKWIWCLDPKTLKPNPAILNNEINAGFGGLNGVASMRADVLGFEPLALSDSLSKPSERTFESLYLKPVRRQQFDKYGIWTQFDTFRAGLATSPSYGQCFALQTMLLFDKLKLADKGLSWLATATHDLVPGYKLKRDSPYYFHEQMFSPDAVGKVPFDAGCGALNLVNVAEPLKVARLVLGVDDTSSGVVRLIPRLIPSWKGMEAKNWPIWTGKHLVHADILCERNGLGMKLQVNVRNSGAIERLSVRLPSSEGDKRFERRYVRSLTLATR